jgi:hypothetical protein
MSTVRSLLTLSLLACVGTSMADTFDRGQRNEPAQYGSFGSGRTAGTALVVQDFLPWGGDVVPYFLNAGLGVEVISSGDLPLTNLADYCLLYISGGTTYPGQDTASNLQAAMPQIEDYVIGGGELLFFTGTWDATYMAPGGLTTIPNTQTINVFAGPHPIDAGVPNPFEGTAASHDSFLNLPAETTVITMDMAGAPTGVEYPLGNGHCIVMAQPIECYLESGSCPDGYEYMETLFINTVAYAISMADCGGGTVWAEDRPLAIELKGNYPNPFNPATTIAFSLAETGFVQLGVYNLAGERVASLVDGRLPAGAHEVSFDAAALPSGLYFSRLAAGGQLQTARMLLVK